MTLCRSPRDAAYCCVVVALLIVAATRTARADELMVYRAVQTQTELLVPSSDNVRAAELPCDLVVSPGFYAFHGKIFDLRRDGLYRFMHIPIENQQRIVLGGELHAFMSALAWISVHGSGDDARPFEDLEHLATQRKLSLTCGTLSNFASSLLGRIGVRARVVFTFSDGPYSGFDDSHMMIEVFRPDLHNWVIYDIDNDVSFAQDGAPHSLREFVSAVKSGAKYEIEPLASGSNLDTSRFETSNGYSFVFYGELILSSENALRAWYERVCRIMAINDANYYYVPAGPHVDDLVKRHSLRPLEIDVWLNRFYGSTKGMSSNGIER